jgi:hypothetical protein
MCIVPKKTVASLFLRARRYSDAVLYLNPDRHSMMLYVVDPCFDKGGDDCIWRSTNHLMNNKEVVMNGGPAWKAQVRLAHEFSLLPHIEPISSLSPPRGGHHAGGATRQRTHVASGASEAAAAAAASASDRTSEHILGRVTPACSSVSDMQNRLFRLGFGPMPNFRRAGVLLNISPNEDDDDDASSYMLGCIVAHRHGLHGCTCPSAPDGDDEDARCYFCCGNPFYEVLFNNDCSDPSQWRTVPVTSSRACFRALPVGTKLLVSIGTLERTVPLFQVRGGVLSM